jgi:hypothetical protein
MNKIIFQLFYSQHHQLHVQVNGCLKSVEEVMSLDLLRHSLCNTKKLINTDYMDINGFLLLPIAKSLLL